MHHLAHWLWCPTVRIFIVGKCTSAVFCVYS